MEKEKIRLLLSVDLQTKKDLLFLCSKKGRKMNSKKIGNFIKEKREEQKLTQEELVKKLYVSNKTISKWETSRGLPSIDLLIPLSNILKVELKDLLLGEEKKDTTNEEIIIKQLKIKRRKNILNLIFGIVICIILCILETLVYISGINETLGIIILGIIILMLLIFELANYLIYKK